MRERAFKIVLALIGLLFLAAIYPIAMFLLHPGQEESSLPMMLSLYVTLGVFLLLAARNPGANRTLIAFAGWATWLTRPSWWCNHSRWLANARICYSA